MKVFYSWQSDLDSSRHSDFIRSAIKSAIADRPSLELENADRPELDEAGAGRVDAESIIAVILKKISDAAVVVADVTPVTVVGNDKLTPNPNVLYELGYAAAKLGNRLILVMNDAEGYRPKDMPFDIAQRPIITYTLPANPTAVQKKEAEKRLAKTLAGAINANVDDKRRSEANTVKITRTPHIVVDPSVWFEKGSFPAQGYHGRAIKLFVKSQPRAFMRIIPAGWQDNRVPDFDAFRQATNGDTPIAPYPEYPSGASSNILHCAEGAAKYWRVSDTAQGDDLNADTLAVLFDTTGEIWVVNNLAMFLNQKNEWVFDFPYALRSWRTSLSAALRFMDAHHAFEKRLVIAGLNIVQKTLIPVARNSAREGMKRDAIVERESADWSETAQDAFMLQLFNKVRTAYTLPVGDMAAMEQAMRSR